MHKSRGDQPFFIREAVIFTSDAATAAVDNGRAMGESINAARVLINEPGNYLTPRILADKAAALASVPGIDVEILDEKKIASLNMGLLLGVARGSVEPPRLLVLRYSPAGAPAGKTLGLVGKGITFDTGGLSLKPADGMERMKDDMAGGASVVAALRSIAQQQLPINAIAIVPMTENMPGGKAIKPGDILTGAAGITVEVNNTDAEGRLILGDGLWYARQLGATHLIDVATLTGAIVVGLGKITTGPVRHAAAVGRAHRAGRRPRRREGLGAADVRGIQGTAEERDRRHGQQPRPSGRFDHRGDVPARSSRAPARGRISTSPAPRGRTTASRGSRKAPPAR